MPLRFFFWVLMLLWLVFGIYPVLRGAVSGTPPSATETRVVAGGSLLLFLLLAVLGWAQFGPAVDG